MAQARSRFPGGVIVAVLRQANKPQPAWKRDELADSVVALAIRTSEAHSAVVALAAAGYPAAVRAGTPDTRALDWLVRIHREARDEGTRSTALDQMMRQINPSRALPYFREVAVTRDDPTAWIGLAKLIEFVRNPRLGSPSERGDVTAQLRSMWDHREVTNALAMAI
jgi:membrane-bound lytic murein transglycosylase B